MVSICRKCLRRNTNKIWEVLRKLLLGLDEVKELEVIMAKFKMEVGELELVC